MAFRTCLLGSIFSLTLLAACNGGGDVDISTPKVNFSERIVSADSEPQNWLSHGRTYSEQRYSPLDQINKSNINELSLAWHYDLDTNRGQEATPIIVDGVMYTSSAWSKVQAFDAKTGDLLWQYDPEVPGEAAAKGCCDVVNRGVAYWNGKVYIATFDGRLVALNADSGKPVWTKDTIVNRDMNYTITGAPRIVKGRVIIGNGGGEYGVRGYTSAYDVDTGKLSWRFYWVPPKPGTVDNAASDPIWEKYSETWSGEWWKLGGGGTAWDSMAYDPDLDLLYVGVGNGSPWNHDLRSDSEGDNLFLSSIVAIRPETGEYVWHFQTTPKEQWDFTATQHMILAELEIEGAMRKVIMQAPKNGYFYVLDRETGEFISGEPYAQVTWSTGLDPKTGRPNVVPEAYYSKTKAPWLGMPGPMGAHNWHPMSYNPDTGLVYFAAQELAFPYIEDPELEASNLKVNLGVDLKPIGLPSDPAVRTQIRKSITGRLTAWDPVAQKEVWRHEHGGAWNGGTLSTAGGLVFQGNRNNELSAYDATSGEVLWRSDVQTGIVAAPATFMVDGEQYVAIVAGWGGILPLLLGEMAHDDNGAKGNISRVLVYKIGGKDKLPSAPIIAARVLDPPEQFGTEDMLALGSGIYAEYCSACHGDTAVSGGVLPDLRYSYALIDSEDWLSIVRDGALSDNGMVAFGADLSVEDAEAVRAYVVKRGHESLAAEK